MRYLDMLEYERMQVLNRWTIRSTGDDGEKLIGFASIGAIDVNGSVVGYNVRESEYRLP